MMLAIKGRMVSAAILLGFSLSGLAGCATAQGVAKGEDKTGAAEAVSQEIVAAQPQQYYEAHKDGRIWVFGNDKVYKEFLAGKEVAYVLTRIGAGPKRETVVFGLTKDESKDVSGLPQIALFEGRQEAAADGFYGEVHKDGRHYVFDGWKEMKDFRHSGEAPYVFTYVATGPERATVVYARSKEQSKQAPDALIATFRQFHGM